MEGVSVDWLASCLSRQTEAGSTLVVDCRPFMAYNLGHVVGAVNVHCPPIIKRRSGDSLALDNVVVDAERRERVRRGEYGRVVVYDQSTDRAPSAADKESNLYLVLRSLALHVPPHRLCYLLGGYDAFSQDCPLLCVTQQFSPLSTWRPEALQPEVGNDAEDRPVELLPYLLLGTGRHSARRDLLERLGVTALVNVTASCPNLFPARFRYLHVPARDSASQDLAACFPAVNRFIDEVRAEGGRVLVHCQAGRSRSATVCLAYLMRTLDLSLDAAFEHVRARRQVIDPNLNFMRQLQDYRRGLDAERSPAAASLAVPGSVSSGLSSAVSPALWGSPGSLPEASSSEPGAAPCRHPQTPTEASAPVSLASGPSPCPDLPPPSPATAHDLHCFFAFSATEFPFPSGSLARTPEIPLPS